jgi:hypothetical protein
LGSWWFVKAHCYGGPFRYWKVIDRPARNHLTDVGIDPPGGLGRDGGGRHPHDLRPA